MFIKFSPPQVQCLPWPLLFILPRSSLPITLLPGRVFLDPRLNNFLFPSPYTFNFSKPNFLSPIHLLSPLYLPKAFLASDFNFPPPLPSQVLLLNSPQPLPHPSKTSRAFTRSFYTSPQPLKLLFQPPRNFSNFFLTSSPPPDFFSVRPPYISLNPKLLWQPPPSLPNYPIWLPNTPLNTTF